MYVILRLLAEPGWLYLLVATSVGATLGGLDHDRYFLELAPFLLLVGFARSVPWTGLIAAALTLLHAIATRAFVSLAGDEAAHLNYSLSTTPEGQLLGASILPVASVAAIALLTWYRAGRGSEFREIPSTVTRT